MTTHGWAHIIQRFLDTWGGVKQKYASLNSRGAVPSRNLPPVLRLALRVGCGFKVPEGRTQSTLTGMRTDLQHMCMSASEQRVHMLHGTGIYNADFKR